MMRHAKLGTPKVTIPCITLGTINDPNTHYYGSPDLIHITSHIYELPSMTMNFKCVCGAVNDHESHKVTPHQTIPQQTNMYLDPHRQHQLIMIETQTCNQTNDVT
jgi:hypothetical protein